MWAGQVQSQPCVSTMAVSVHSLHSFIPSLNHSFLRLFVCLCIRLFIHSVSSPRVRFVQSSSLYEVLLWHLLKSCSVITAICDACLARGVLACWNAASPVFITNDNKRRSKFKALASRQVSLLMAEPQHPCLVSLICVTLNMLQIQSDEVCKNLSA